MARVFDSGQRWGRRKVLRSRESTHWPFLTMFSQASTAYSSGASRATSLHLIVLSVFFLHNLSRHLLNSKTHQPSVAMSSLSKYMLTWTNSTFWLIWLISESLFNKTSMCQLVVFPLNIQGPGRSWMTSPNSYSMIPTIAEHWTQKCWLPD